MTVNESKTVTKDPICDMTVEQATTFILGWFAGFLIVGFRI